MEYRHEMIHFSGQVPFKVYLHRIGNVPKHWHQSLELLYVVEGSTQLILEQNIYDLSEDDLILINSNTIHELHADHCVMIALQVKLTAFDDNLKDIKQVRFDCNSTVSKDKSHYESLRTLLIQMVLQNASPSNWHDVLNKSLIYRLLYELITCFKSPVQVTNYVETEKHLDRLKSITTYLQEHYAEKITLDSMATHAFLSPAYLSRFFEQYMGIAFSDYLRSLRLNHAVHTLLSTDLSIDTLAESSGFPNTRSFVTAFRNKYHCLPSHYRNEQLSNAQTHQLISKNDYLSMNPKNYLAKLSAYTQNTKDTPHSQASHCHVLPSVTINTTTSITTLKHTFKTLTTVGRAKELLYAEIQEMVKTLQQNIGFKFIKFHNLFGDEMMVYDEDSNGTPSYHYIYIDMVLDFLLSVGLKPFVQLSFMPTKLAESTDKKLFYTPAVISPPKDWDKWADLVTNFTQHVIQRYGLKEVESWLFTVWNEPDIPSLFGLGSMELYYRLYKTSYQSVKRCSPSIPFGGYSFNLTQEALDEGLGQFISFCTTNACEPDFINFHFYSLERYQLQENTTHDFSAIFNPEHAIHLSKDENFLKASLHQLHSKSSALHLDDKPHYMTEWNATPHHRDLLNDTCYKSAYVAKNILENYDQIDGFGYWILSDLHEESLLSKALFHGGLGLFTYNGIPKPAYYTFTFLSQLGDTLVAQGDGYFVTRQDDELRLIFYYYRHYSDLYASGERFNISQTHRYAPFGDAGNRKFTLSLTDLMAPCYHVTEKIINQSHGSCYDLWLSMGAQPLETKEEVSYLRDLSKPMIRKSKIQIDDNHYELIAELEPHEVRLVILKPAL